ncbi:TetR/AcrR family transcriptional regulator [Pseudoalteromonas denitrificans]|uniref:Transcriptional regulator, TetR family n=1 Tax=Pseudoalteromonas denitrificans DSM 6059 TaxID=1123010 RepID=A0A1I1GN35_9GAMM|nr:TetR/AcrR family transcriptional regulator [Pseudoalteromonas denitrificans]SFC12886.1 transcriptional regulator, TetR family [Pseudoalteromonas denitrificans DSM 6059]
MARPSMAGQRREEILDALEKCILEKGIQATSLEYLAETAQMKRTILRHYIGNRDEIICALSSRWAKVYQSQWQEVILLLPKIKRVEALIDILFSPRTNEYINNTIIGEALFSEAKRLAPIKLDQKNNMKQFIEILNVELKLQFPKLADDKLDLISHSLHANYLMSESLLPLGMENEVEKLKKASYLLISFIST